MQPRTSRVDVLLKMQNNWQCSSQTAFNHLGVGPNNSTHTHLRGGGLRADLVELFTSNSAEKDRLLGGFRF